MLPLSVLRRRGRTGVRRLNRYAGIGFDPAALSDLWLEVRAGVLDADPTGSPNPPPAIPCANDFDPIHNWYDLSPNARHARNMVSGMVYRNDGAGSVYAENNINLTMTLDASFQFTGAFHVFWRANVESGYQLVLGGSSSLSTAIVLDNIGQFIVTNDAVTGIFNTFTFVPGAMKWYHCWRDGANDIYIQCQGEAATLVGSLPGNITIEEAWGASGSATYSELNHELLALGFFNRALASAEVSSIKSYLETLNL